MRTAQLPGKRIIRGTQPLQPILRMRIMAQNRATLPLCQATPHAVVGLGLQGIRQTLDTNLALVAAQANLTVRWTRTKRARPNSGRRRELTSSISTSLYSESYM